VTLAILAELLSGPVRGARYVLMALGLLIIVGMLGVITFAHGALFTLGGYVAYWVSGRPTLTRTRLKQRAIFQQIERHTRDQAYFLFLYNPVQLYAVNRGVDFVPYVANLTFTETSVSDQHLSVQKGAVKK